MCKDIYGFVSPLFRMLQCFLLFAAGSACAAELQYYSFSQLAAIGPPAQTFADNLLSTSRLALGESQALTFTALPAATRLPPDFDSITQAVAAGAQNGGFDAAYIPALSINSVWGFIYTSGVPFGPNFDEFSGFLFGRNVVAGGQSGIDLLNEILRQRNKNIVAIPIVAGSEQGS